MSAICILEPTEANSTVRGLIRFESPGADKGTAIHAELSGMQPGKHGFHIHQLGNLSAGCKSTQGHFNPYKRVHGGPLSNDDKRHVGDLGNIEANADGFAILDIVDSQIKLSGPYSIIGRAVVVHADEDDLGMGGFDDSLTTGHAGSRIACGVIGRASENSWLL